MTCSCLAGFCPLCAGVTYRSTLAHRSGAQQRSSVRSDLANRLETNGKSSDQKAGAVRDHRVDVVIGAHHAPDTAGCVMSHAPEVMSDQPEFMSGEAS